jgi:hypothetical protein
MWNEFSTLPIFDLQTCNASQKISQNILITLRLGAQSVTLLSTLRDPTQLRQRQCATRKQQVLVKHPGLDGFSLFSNLVKQPGL